MGNDQIPYGKQPDVIKSSSTKIDLNQGWKENCEKCFVFFKEKDRKRVLSKYKGGVTFV